MATAAQLLFSEEFEQLAAVAEDQGWVVSRRGPTSLLFGMPASDGSWLWSLCEADLYPTNPPAWRWCNPDGLELDGDRHTPLGGNFFHSAGVICAPWNRLAYGAVDPRGPHPEWVLGDWRANPYTKQCVTLTAMASRLAVEARLRFTGRRAAQ